MPFEVPAPIRTAVQSLSPSVAMERVTFRRIVGKPEYTASFSGSDGRNELRLSVEGAVLDQRLRKRLSLAELPELVSKGVAREMGATVPEHVARVTAIKQDGAAAREPTTWYEADGGDGELEIALDSEGRRLRRVEVLPDEAIPPAIRAGIGQAAGRVRVQRVRHVTEGSRSSYEVECDDLRQEIDLRLAEDGSVLESAREKKRLPTAAAVARAARRRLPPGPRSEEDPALFRVRPPSRVAPGRTFVVVAAGDVAEERRRQDLTASLLLGMAARQPLAAILILGDSQYPRAETEDLQHDYAPTWGVPPLRAVTRPAPGNHEYDEGRSDAEGYFDFWNGPGKAWGPAGDRRHGYYSFALGDWHFVALNTSDGCRGKKIACGKDSPMQRWLLEDLRRAREKRRCVLAYFHHPRFQQGGVHDDVTRVAPLWEALHDAGVDLVLSGHEHNYQQLAPLDAQGRPSADGLRSFVVGTGGADYYDEWTDKHTEAVEKRISRHFGVLELTLSPGAYGWRFVAADGTPSGQALSEGRGVCKQRRETRQETPPETPPAP